MAIRSIKARRLREKIKAIENATIERLNSAPKYYETTKHKQIEVLVSDVSNVVNNHFSAGWVLLCIFGERFESNMFYVNILFQKKVKSVLPI